MKYPPPNFALIKNLPSNFALRYKDITKQYDVVDCIINGAHNRLDRYVIHAYIVLWSLHIHVLIYLGVWMAIIAHKLLNAAASHNLEIFGYSSRVPWSGCEGGWC